ncbi:hypothetical protein WQQ_32560 [Hydrocarboniphaga effusa AP103]|jgi:hypothetical protein|uniref:Uncharacterized protein n=1 Tax=Hydrocarboniphaga effusa AP103 TaxID=1172194 RepID=I7ZCR2_9GAMM|nr:hypothetical protein WQQ_32560 [Hydrocarboniphaga effusa AP103]
MKNFRLPFAEGLTNLCAAMKNPTALAAHTARFWYYRPYR